MQCPVVMFFLHEVPLESARTCEPNCTRTLERRRRALVTDRPTNSPCHVMMLMALGVLQDNATASAGVDAHSQSPASVESMRGSLMQGRRRGNCASPEGGVTTLNVGMLSAASQWTLTEAIRPFCVAVPEAPAVMV
ncbi:unnamed protein product [Heligmosomoides polygyrus]|uniref:Uncharacterized protein n=1 Tax=Heligmosomoides polygyrus TaxID=6339 RepID=A0A183FQ47_HELPZ|nr:unnamed protein product [Heligmosomoides polygyrus]